MPQTAPSESAPIMFSACLKKTVSCLVLMHDTVVQPILATESSRETAKRTADNTTIQRTQPKKAKTTINVTTSDLNQNIDPASHPQSSNPLGTSTPIQQSAVVPTDALSTSTLSLLAGPDLDRNIDPALLSQCPCFTIPLHQLQTFFSMASSSAGRIVANIQD